MNEILKTEYLLLKKKKEKSKDVKTDVNIKVQIIFREMTAAKNMIIKILKVI